MSEESVTPTVTAITTQKGMRDFFATDLSKKPGVKAHTFWSADRTKSMTVELRQPNAGQADEMLLRSGYNPVTKFLNKNMFNALACVYCCFNPATGKPLWTEADVASILEEAPDSYPAVLGGLVMALVNEASEVGKDSASTKADSSSSP